MSLILSQSESAVEECVVHRFPVWLGDNPEVLANFWDKCPTTDPPIRLDFDPNGIVQDELNPLRLQIRAPRLHTGPEIICCFHSDYSSSFQRKQGVSYHS